MERKEIRHQNAQSIRGRTSTGPLRARIGWEIRNVWLSWPAVAPVCVLHKGQKHSVKCCTGEITGVLCLRVSLWWSFSFASVPSWAILDILEGQESVFVPFPIVETKQVCFTVWKSGTCSVIHSLLLLCGLSFSWCCVSFFIFFSLPPLPRSSVACLALWLRVTLSRWPALYWSGSIWLYLLPSFTQLNLIDKQILKMMKTGVVREAFFSSSKSQNGWSLLFCVSLDCFLLFQSYYSWPS